MGVCSSVIYNRRSQVRTVFLENKNLLILLENFNKNQKLFEKHHSNLPSLISIIKLNFIKNLLILEELYCKSGKINKFN